MQAYPLTPLQSDPVPKAQPLVYHTHKCPCQTHCSGFHCNQWKSFGHLIGERTPCAEVAEQQGRNTRQEEGLAPQRILVVRPLALGERVLVADPGQEVLEPRDPGASLLGVGRDQVQALQVVAVVNGEAAAGVEAALGVAVEDLRLPALADFVNGVDDNWGRGKPKDTLGQPACLSLLPTILSYSGSEAFSFINVTSAHPKALLD